MGWQELINLGAGGLLGVVGWFVRDMHTDAKADRQALADYKVKVAEEYVTKDHLTETMGDIKSSLRRIEDKIDGKADK